MQAQISKCRICSNTELVPVLELGVQALTGVFPKTPRDRITKGPLTLLKCAGEGFCGLLQLAHSYPLEEMYGANYGYRSGLNSSMLDHLRSKVERIKSYDVISKGDIVVDVGSNDGSTLRQYALGDCTLVGIDPTGTKFRHFYTTNMHLIPDFFCGDVFRNDFGSRKAKVITSFAMFYDMEDPIGFMREIHSILDDNGIWVFEQSYMPSMLATNSYDTICHEHLEYYALSQILWMAERVGFEIVDVELNEVNGGSFSVLAQKRNGPMPVSSSVDQILDREAELGLANLSTYLRFKQNVEKSKETLVDFLHYARTSGQRVAGLGASTKGNVILQYCGVSKAELFAIGEVNADKFGAFTPGSNIPIVDEKDVLQARPEHLLVLPWHFRRFFESQARYQGLNLVFPLPVLSQV